MSLEALKTAFELVEAPTLLVGPDGSVLWANSGAKAFPERGSPPLRTERIDGGQQALRDLFGRCRGSDAPLPASIGILGEGGSSRHIVKIRRIGDGREPLAMALTIRSDERLRFQALTRSIEELRQEVAERKRTADQLAAALADNELLLDELRHRVKNNFGLLQGLISRQSRLSRNGEVKQVLADLSLRLNALFAGQQHIFGDREDPDIPVETIVRRVADAVAGTCVPPADVEISVDEPMKISGVKAGPLALIANEVFCNSVKHAGAPGLNLGIRVARDASDRWVIQFRDNGQGFPEGGAVNRGMGSSLLQGLAKQLGADIAQYSDDGAVTELRLEGGAP